MNTVNNKYHSSLRGLARSVTIIMGTLLLSACAGNPVTPEADKDPVVQRSEARWESLLARDYETAYSYYSPGYRSTTSLVDFMFKQRSRRVKWTSASYREHSCTESACKVIFDTGFRVDKAVPGMDKFDGNSVTEETWVKTGAEWWYLPNKG